LVDVAIQVDRAARVAMKLDPFPVYWFEEFTIDDVRVK
jgi:hypothetical protein